MDSYPSGTATKQKPATTRFNPGSQDKSEKEPPASLFPWSGQPVLEERKICRPERRHGETSHLEHHKGRNLSSTGSKMYNTSRFFSIFPVKTKSILNFKRWWCVSYLFLLFTQILSFISKLQLLLKIKIQIGKADHGWNTSLACAKLWVWTLPQEKPHLNYF